MKGLLPLIMLISTAVSGCASLGKNEVFQLRGMIYDHESRPVSDAAVLSGKSRLATSDIHGRFSLMGMKKGERYSFSVVKDGFERVETELIYSDASQVLYVSMFSSDQLMVAAEKAIGAGDWRSAEAFLTRAREAGGDGTAARYLEAVLQLKRGRPSDAASILSTLLENGEDDPFIHLFLADLYQYHLNNPEEARRRLRSFTEAKYDPEVELRLKTLEH